MNLLFLTTGILGLGIVLIAWRRHVQKITVEGKSKVSPSWLVQHAYDREGDWWGKGK